MVRHDKLVSRFLSRPKDFTWQEMERLLSGFGYSKVNGKGSHRKFVGEGLPRIRLPQPHPTNVVKRVYLDQVRILLVENEML